MHIQKSMLYLTMLCGATIFFSACASPTDAPLPATQAPLTETRAVTSAPTQTATAIATATVTLVLPTATRTATLLPTTTPSPTVKPATATPRATVTRAKPSATAVKPTNVPPTRAPVVPPTQVPPSAPPQGSVCNLEPGNAGILVVNHFDGLMTITLLDHEYKLDGHTELLVQVPGGQDFTVSVSVVGVGKTNFGPVALNAGECVRYEPSN